MEACRKVLKLQGAKNTEGVESMAKRSDSHVLDARDGGQHHRIGEAARIKANEVLRHEMQYTHSAR